MSAEKVQCPVEGCSRELSKRGLHGHIEHAHDVPHSEAMERAAEAKAQQLGAGSGPAESGREGAHAAREDFGEVSNHVKQRLSETADVEASIRMLRALEEGDDAGDGGSALGDVVDVIELVDTVSDMTGPSVTEADVRQAVREEAAARADGGGDWRFAAVESGLDADEIESLAATMPDRRSRVDDLIDGLSRIDAETVIGAADLLSEARSLWSEFRPRRRHDREPREAGGRPRERIEEAPDREAAEEPAERDPVEEPAPDPEAERMASGSRTEGPPAEAEPEKSHAEERIDKIREESGADDDDAEDGEEVTGDE